MRKTALLFLLLSIGFVAIAQQTKTALLLIDIQEFYFPGGFSELADPEEAAANAALILNEFRNNGQTIIHVQHQSGKQMEINDAVTPIEGEKRIVKTEVNSFNGTDLKTYLDSLKITDLVIIGMQTHMCVEAATRAAYDYGFKVTLIEDACTTKDLEWEGRVIKAADVHASTLSTLKNYASVVRTQAYLPD